MLGEETYMTEDTDTETVYSYSDSIHIIDSDEEEYLNNIDQDLENLELASSEVVQNEDISNRSDCGSDCGSDCERTVLCIDIGILHLGLAGLVFDEEYNFVKVFGVDMINITEFVHPEGVDSTQCHLHHTKTFTDWMEHVFWTYSDIFDGVDAIIIERQPPQGIVAVEQIIFSRYRDKCELVSPNSMHKHFGIGHMEYGRRKEAVTNIATHYISDQTVLSEYHGFDRKHDIADAICLGIFWLNKHHKIYAHDKRVEKVRSTKMTFRGSDMTMKDWLQQFRYVPSCPTYVRI